MRFRKRTNTIGNLAPLVLLCFHTYTPNAQAATNERVMPEAVSKCLARREVNTYAAVNSAVNPYYLRGDLDGDSRLDYAVAVRARRTQKLGVAICLSTGEVALLGAGYGVRFSDMPDDNFISSDWMIVSGSELVNRFRALGLPLPRLASGLEGILMPWEDGFGLIVRTNGLFKWYSR